MRLVLVRHALPERVAVVSAAPDPALSPLGLRQVDALVQVLDGERIDAVWSSPLLRARQTAAPVAAARGLPVAIHDGLREFDFGDGLYIPAEEVDHPAVVAIHARLDCRADDEEIVAFQRTVVAAMHDVIAAHDADDTVLVACHGGVINAFGAHVVGAPNPFFADLTYAGVSWFRVAASGRVQLVALNEHAHVRALDAVPETGQRPASSSTTGAKPSAAAAGTVT